MARFISILIPVYNEERYIENCLNSVFNSDYPESQYEVIVVDGGSTDKTLSLLENYPKVKVLHNPDKIVPISMNIGVNYAKGEYIIRLDAHSAYPTNYFSKLIATATELDADNVGAICITDVLHKTPVSLAIKEALSHRFGVGNSLFRTGVKEVCEADTVPFGCFKKDVFSRFGLYNEKLIRNQDIELNKRIKRGGGKIFLIPDTFCTYFARDTFPAFIRSNYSNGLWNLLTVYYTKTFDSLSIRHFVPLAFVLFFLFGPFLILLYHPFFLLYILVVSAYMTFILAISISLMNEKKTSLMHTIGAFISLHVSYGWGSLIGITKVTKLKLKGN